MTDVRMIRQPTRNGSTTLKKILLKHFAYTILNDNTVSLCCQESTIDSPSKEGRASNVAYRKIEGLKPLTQRGNKLYFLGGVA